MLDYFKYWSAAQGEMHLICFYFSSGGHFGLAEWNRLGLKKDTWVKIF